MSSWVIKVIEITWRLSKRKKRSNLRRKHLLRQINGGGKIRVVVQNIYTINTWAVETNGFFLELTSNVTQICCYKSHVTHIMSWRTIFMNN